MLYCVTKYETHKIGLECISPTLISYLKYESYSLSMIHTFHTKKYEKKLFLRIILHKYDSYFWKYETKVGLIHLSPKLQ